MKAAGTTEQRQARALGDPTRHGIFQQLMAAEDPLDVAQLTAVFGLNHNAIRQHLGILREAGLVVEERSPGGIPGRPKLLYRPHPEILGRWGSGGSFEQLSHLLLRMMETGDTARETGYSAGAERFTKVKNPPGSVAAAEQLLSEDQTQLGFRPRLETNASDTALIAEQCPYLSAAAKDPHTVCQMHFGLARGFTDAMGVDLEVHAIEPHDPELAGCRLLLRNPSTAALGTITSTISKQEGSTLDVRPILARGEEPFAAIMQAVEKVAAGDSLTIVAPFEPVPLQRTLAGRGFTWKTNAKDDGSWHITFTRSRIASENPQ
jgi:predicted ArsR family transcriptional regulator/uncharacterized protein (DUF2249 family)